MDYVGFRRGELLTLFNVEVLGEETLKSKPFSAHEKALLIL